ncbi:MAG: 5-oxoprolinase subunit PxpA [Alphaproteobacteria bacterium]|nr:5-oxoprolinase subunit PxpA [Alphaproteobacteria bacterium]
MPVRMNINADMAEGFGHYRVGNDEAIMDVVGSVSVACGFHGGDPAIMHSVVQQAHANGLSIGAHPGFNDLWGFGRRKIDMRPDDLEYMTAYQIGALQGICAYVDARVTHVKPHGALNNMAAVDADYAIAIGRAIKTIDPSIVYMALADSEMEKAAERLGLPVAREAFIDRLYDDEGNLCSRKIEGAVINDPQVAAERAVKMVIDREIISMNGKRLPTQFESLCVHGDEPTAVAVAKAARQALEKAGVQLVTLPEMLS